MAEFIQFTPGNPNEELEVTLNGTPYVFVSRWNATENNKEGAFYLDVYEVNGTPIIVGIKVVLGVFLGRTSTHPLFTSGALFAIDKSNTGRECGVDDLGARVQIAYFTETDLVLARAPRLVVPR